MTKLEKAQREFELIDNAIKTLKECAEEERKMYHTKHIDQYYLEALGRLDVKLTGARAHLTRIETIGR